MKTAIKIRRIAIWIFSRFLLILFGTVVCFFFAELWVRIFSPPSWNELNPPFYSNLANSKRVYGLQTNFSDKVSGLNIKINKYGLRGINFAIEKPLNEKRLILLGDSVTYGYGLPYNEIFSGMLQSDLASAKSDQNWLVINAGIPGYNTLQERALFEEECSNFSPDFLVLTFVSNDLEAVLKSTTNGYLAHHLPNELFYKPLPNANPFRGILKFSKFFRFLENRWNKYFIMKQDVFYATVSDPRLALAQEKLHSITKKISLKHQKRIFFQKSFYYKHILMKITTDLKAIKEKCTKMKIPFLFIIYPEMDASVFSLMQGNLEFDLRKILKCLSISYIDLSAYRAADKFTLGWDAHPNKRMHRKIANVILEWMKENNLIYTKSINLKMFSETNLNLIEHKAFLSGKIELLKQDNYYAKARELISDTIDFNENNYLIPQLITGWYPLDDKFRYIAPKMACFLSVKNKLQIKINFEIEKMLFCVNDHQSIQIWLNGKKKESKTYYKSGKYSIIIPIEALDRKYSMTELWIFSNSFYSKKKLLANGLKLCNFTDKNLQHYNLYSEISLKIFSINTY